MNKDTNIVLGCNSDFEVKSATLNIMKVGLCLIVVLGHICKMYSGVSVFNYDRDNFIELVFKLLMSFEMQAFMAVSGGVYYLAKEELQKKYTGFIFIQTKFKRLIFPYIAIALICVFPTMYLTGLMHGDYLKFVLYNLLLSSDVRHLWFLPALFIIFILVNTLYKYFRDYTVLVIILCIVLSISAYEVHLPFQISNAAKYLIYFFGGYLIIKWFDIVARVTSNWFTISTLAVILILSNIYITETLTNSVFHIVLGLFGLLLTFGLSYNLAKTTITTNSIFHLLSKDSFGIYLFHAMIIYLVYYLYHSYLTNFFHVIGIFTIVVILSIFLTETSRRLGLHFIIGEKGSLVKK